VGDAFGVDLSLRGKRLVASVAGEIDLATAPALVEAIESGLSKDRLTRVVVDLSEVAFLDSSGLNALVTLEKELGERGVELRLVSPADRVVRQVFEITCLTEILHVVESLDEALG
jgi:anti-anti-sigma factor